MDNGLFFMSVSFGSLLLALTVGFVVYGLVWLSKQRAKPISVAEEFREMVADELAQKNPVNDKELEAGPEDRREKYIKMLWNNKEKQ